MSRGTRPIIKKDANYQNLPHNTEDDIMYAYKFDGTDIAFVGRARPGTAVSAAAWKIYKVTYDAFGNVITSLAAGGKEMSDYVSILDASSAKTITAASQADPVRITVTAHGYSTNDFIEITGVGGMTELNSDGSGSKVYKVTKVDANTLDLANAAGTNVDGTGYTLYTTGGSCFKRDLFNHTYA